MVLLSTALFEDRQIDGVLAVDANDVGLNRGVVFGVADIGDQKLPIADGLERQPVDIGCRGESASWYRC